MAVIACVSPSVAVWQRELLCAICSLEASRVPQTNSHVQTRNTRTPDIKLSFFRVYSSMCLPVCLSVGMSVLCTFLSYLLVSLFICVSIFPSIRLSRLSFIYRFVYLSVNLLHLSLVSILCLLIRVSHLSLTSILYTYIYI